MKQPFYDVQCDRHGTVLVNVFGIVGENFSEYRAKLQKLAKNRSWEPIVIVRGNLPLLLNGIVSPTLASMKNCIYVKRLTMCLIRCLHQVNFDRL